MPKKKEAERIPSEQSKLFIEKAREIGADGDARDESVMRSLVRQERSAPPKRRKKHE